MLKILVLGLRIKIAKWRFRNELFKKSIGYCITLGLLTVKDKGKCSFHVVTLKLPPHEDSRVSSEINLYLLGISQPPTLSRLVNMCRYIICTLECSTKCLSQFQQCEQPFVLLRCGKKVADQKYANNYQLSREFKFWTTKKYQLLLLLWSFSLKYSLQQHVKS